MGKIIDRVRHREDQAEAKRAFDASPFGRIRAGDAANPGKTIKFRRWTPPAWGTSQVELRQPEEQAKNEAMRQRIEEMVLPPGEAPYVNIKPTPQPPAKIVALAAEHQLWPKATSPFAHHFRYSAPFRAAILAYTQAVAEECAKLAEDRGAALRLIGGRAHPDQAGATAIRALFGIADEWLLDRPEGFPPPMSKQP